MSEDDTDFGKFGDLYELFAEDEEDDDKEADLFDPNEGDIKFKFPFIDWLLFHLLPTALVSSAKLFPLLLITTFEFELSESWTAEAAAANCGDGDASENEGDAKPAEDDELLEDELDENDELGEFLLIFLKSGLTSGSWSCDVDKTWAVRLKTPIGTGGLARLASDNRLDWSRRLST